VAKAGQEAETAGRLYVLEGGRTPRALAVSKGESDGVLTVVSGDGVDEGLQVISGIKPEAKGKSGNFFSFLRPPRGGGPR
jgi:hypothetical protein